MSWWSEFASRIECDAPVGRQTWFKLGGCARYLFRPRDVEDLSSLSVRARHENVPLKVLGRGANVLISDDGFDGVVIRMDSDAFRTVRRQETSLTVGAGVDLMPLARQCSERGLSGLECMAGIPGLVGGAVRMNAGGRTGEFGDVVLSVDVLEADGNVETWSHGRVGFGYRRSDLGENMIVSAKIQLAKDDPQQVKRRFDENLDHKSRTQPLADKSAGCIFKNPPGCSAGALIDQAGLKGARCGAAHVSGRHANFIVADREATATDVLRLIELVRDRVCRLFGTELEVEIDIWKPVQRRRRSK